ncbi:MAG: GYD domain-containing protein [Verrucomicrobiaceae bacterium]|nr:GYD domain-containing protein [Verrucomicrobiaceae bacterium]
MARYIALLSFTEKGSLHLKESPSRAHAFDELAAKSGVTVEGQFWTLGRYDGVLILKAESEHQILHLLAELASRGNVRTETMQAFTDKDFATILKS